MWCRLSNEDTKKEGRGIMDKYMAKHHLRNLGKPDIANLTAGRITRDTMHEAAKRIAKLHICFGEEIGRDSQFSTTPEMLLAEELNDMLEAARFTETVEGEVG